MTKTPNLDKLMEGVEPAKQRWLKNNKYYLSPIGIGQPRDHYIEAEYTRKLELALERALISLEFVTMPYTSGEPNETHKNDMIACEKALAKIRAIMRGER